MKACKFLQAQPQTFAMPVVLPEIQQTTPEVKAEKTEIPVPAPPPVPAVEMPVVEKVMETVPETAAEEETLMQQAVPAAKEVAEEAMEVPAVKEVAEVASEVPAAVPAGDPLQELWQKLLAINGDVKELLLACTPVSLANSVLSVKAPAPVAAALRENRLKLLSLL